MFLKSIERAKRTSVIGPFNQDYALEKARVVKVIECDVGILVETDQVKYFTERFPRRRQRPSFVVRERAHEHDNVIGQSRWPESSEKVPVPPQVKKIDSANNDRWCGLEVLEKLPHQIVTVDRKGVGEHDFEFLDTNGDK